MQKMTKVITNSQFQKIIGTVSKEIETKQYTVINRGVPKMVVLPYFEGNEDYIEDYLERFEIQKNQKKLQEELQNSEASGLSTRKI